MAAMSGGRRVAAGDHEDQKIKMFHIAMQKFQDYPFNLSPRHSLEKLKFAGDFRQHFDQTKDDILLVLRDNVQGIRRKLIERKIRVEFYDAGLDDSTANLIPMQSQGQPSTTSASSLSTPRMEWGESFGSSWDNKEDTEDYSISNSKHLDLRFGIASTSQTPNPRLRDRDAPSGDPPEFQPQADPVCRFIFFATFIPGARRLKITEELLLKILTYHQVAPCFLNFISYFGHDPLSGAGDLFFGGFRSLKSFSEPFSSVMALGRSGYHYQLAFELRTVFRPASQDTEYEEREIVEEFVEDDPRGMRRINNNGTTGAAWRLLPSWLRPRDGDAGDEAATEFTGQTLENPTLWPLDQCAIYHHFDVENGKSLWMITAAEGEGNKPTFESGLRVSQGSQFRDVRNARYSTDVLSTSPIDQRFRASLSVMLWLADWSLSDYGQYITTLDDDLQKLTRPYIENMADGGAVQEIGLKILNRYMEKLDETIVALQGNLRVCEAALKFYREELLQDRKLKARNLAWMMDEDSRTRIEEDLEDFQEKMKWVCTSTQEMLRRVGILKEVGARRENTVLRLLQNRDVTTTRELARVTYQDSTTMRVFSTITLVLLPMSVVSTIFSANIVDFQSGAGGFAGNWSGPAALWWAVTSLLATVLVGWAGERWRRRAIDAAKADKAGLGNNTRKMNTTESLHESWTTQVRRVINDLRVHAHPYKHSIRAGYDQTVAFFKNSVAAVHRRPFEPATSPSPSPAAYPPHHSAPSRSLHSVPVGDDTLSATWSRNRTSPLLSVTSARSDPPPLGSAERDERHTEGSAREPVPSVHSPSEHPPSQPTEESGGAVTLESEKLHSKGFDEASTVEQGLVGVTVTTKEEVLDAAGGQEK